MTSDWTDQLLRLLSLQDQNTRVVLLGTALLGLAGGVVGVFATLRKRALVADAVAHAALPGIACSFLILRDRSFVIFMLGALVAGLLSAGFISMVRSLTRVKDDAATAIAIGCFFAFGIVLSSRIQQMPSASVAGLDTFLYGKAASMVYTDAITIAAVSAACLLVVAVFFKELALLCFDRAYAQSLGFPAWALDLMLMGMVCVCTVAGLPAVGVVLMVALLVTPAAAARFWSDRIGIVVAISGFFGALSGLLGTALSAVVPTPAGALSRGWPTGPAIVLVAAFLFLLSLLLAPRRGVIPAALRRLRVETGPSSPAPSGATSHS